MAKYYRIFAFICTFIICSLIIRACTDVTKEEIHHTKFQFRLDEGFLISDDYYIGNLSEIDLNNVNVRVTATGHDGSKKEKKAFWSVWKSGDTKKIVAFIDENETVPNIQKIEVSGTSDKYKFRFQVTYNK